MRKNNITRRNFLKLSGLFPLGLFYSHQLSKNHHFRNIIYETHPNIIILVLDSLSARHLSLYGYPRNTSPNLEKFSQHANVYHAHYSAGNFTTPGTASLLTGTYPWTHRAINEGGLIRHDLAPNNIFSEMGEVYNRLAFTQNPLADFLLQQFDPDIDKYIQSTKYNLISPVLTGRIFQNDLPSAMRSLDDFLFNGLDLSGGTYLGVLNDLYLLNKHRFILNKYKLPYPYGIPFTPRYNQYFLVESIFDGVKLEIKSLANPSLAYFHIYPPHFPYYYRQEFVDKFADNWKPIYKPIHSLSGTIKTEDELIVLRQHYDEFIANIDYEFGRLYNSLSEQGFLENCYFVVTSDHGELFERGYNGHQTPLLYQDIIQIPLLISAPGQTERKDFYHPTSNVDVLPTLLHVLNKPIPTWAEGELLPGLGGEENMDRSIFSFEAKSSNPREACTKASYALIKGNYKLISYIGYTDLDHPNELYDLSADPEELTDLASSQPSILSTLKKELDSALEKAD